MKTTRMTWLLLVVILALAVSASAAMAKSRPASIRAAASVVEQPAFSRAPDGVSLDFAAISGKQKPGAPGSAYGGCAGVKGEGTMAKVNGAYTGTRYVYMRCGKIIGWSGNTDCGCKRSGGWHYTTTCEKGDVVYITLPCTCRRAMQLAH